jgi:hypothetical protein
MALNAQQVTDKWGKNLTAATESIRAGINSVTEAPSAAAIRNKQGYIQGVQDNADKWSRNLASVTLEQWRKAAIDIGIQRIPSGVTKGRNKMQSFMEQWLPYEDGLKARLAQIPKGGIEASIARATEAIRYNKAFRRQ